MRIVPAKWGGEAEKDFPALIAVEASDRKGLLADVTVKIAEKSISISAVNTYPLKRNRARLNIAISVATVEQLQGLMNALRDVAGVTKVHRV
jgi:GTP pyrophosphokinase